MNKDNTVCDEIEQSSGAYHKRDDWVLWEGAEIEGRLYGVRTLFVGDLLIKDFPTDILAHYAHVYINPVFILRNGYKRFYQFLQKHLGSCYVSISLTSKMLDTFDVDAIEECGVHLILILNIGEIAIHKLRTMDSIRIQTSDIDAARQKDNISFSIGNAIIAQDEEYANDKPVQRKGDILC